jgi:hypothetical protein
VGRGLFAERAFHAGERITRFRGARFLRDDPIHGTPSGANLLQTGPRTYVLPDGPASFVNHSCNPNAGVGPGLWLVAIADIAPGDEIRFDYSTTMDEDSWTMRCRCKQLNCRKRIGNFQDLPAEVQLSYLELGVVPAFIVKRCGWRQKTVE